MIGAKPINGTLLDPPKSPTGIANGMIEGHERSVLAYLCTEPGACDRFLYRLSPYVFSVPAHRQIINAIFDVHDNRDKVNHLTIADRLREKGELDSCGGVPRIVEISTETTSEEIASYALDCMLEDYREREARQILKDGANGKIPVAEVGKRLNEILSQSAGKGLEAKWLKTIDAAAVRSSELASLTLNQREPLLSDWLCEGDYGIIFASRGVGKTWLGLLIAKAVATGGRLGEWKAPASAKVLYIDGEMPPDLMRDRDRGLGSGEVEFLNHAILFDRTEKVLNIIEPAVQEAILQRCVRDNIRLVILDNLSTLASGIKENDSFEWERLHNWLLHFRRRKIAVILIHHAGRSGEMRGTSKREDAAFWVISLDDAKKHADDKRGARFISRFAKPSRNTQDEVPALEWHVLTDAVTGEISVGCKAAQSLDVFRRWIEDGVTECSQLAEEMRVSKGTISKWAKKAMNEGWLEKNGREYVIVEAGNKGNENA
jgi:AAA domain/DnaB-like helicase N terminal domain